MAIVKIPQNARLQLKIQTGINASGAPVFATRSYNNVKNSAASDDLYTVAQQLSGLQKYTLVGIEKTEMYSLVQE